jgi:predicted dithiol-disulfide oxidoreductase (DUF899 family)
MHPCRSDLFPVLQAATSSEPTEGRPSETVERSGPPVNHQISPAMRIRWAPLSDNGERRLRCPNRVACGDVLMRAERTGGKAMTNHEIGTREEWLAARVELLEREKEHMRQGDELARRRQDLPWVPIEKEYVFEANNGKKTLAELFDGRSQLLVYHFMFGFGFRVDEQNPGCTGCSFVADHFDGVIPHLNGNDVTLVAESIAPLERLHAYAERMSWRFPWASSLGSDFKYDFGAAFTEEQQRNGAEYNFRHWDQPLPQKEGMSAFALKDGIVHHTYSTYERGVEQLMGTYRILDLAPLGRNEERLGFPGAWWHRHDEYEEAAPGATT